MGGIAFRRLGDITGDEGTQTISGVVYNFILPLGLAAIFVYGLVAYLGWWKPVMRDDRPVQRGMIVVPIVLLVGILLAIDYGALAEKGLGFTLLLLLATQLVGWGEEGMFRGIGITVLRKRGLTEGRVALWSSLIFGAVHLSNAVGQGLQAVPQAVVVAFAGYFFYLVRRRTGSNAVNSVLHGLFDFSLLTATALDDTPYLGMTAGILVYLVLAVFLLARRRHIEPKPIAAA
ncbi:CPBP family intramembrane glutamic endopeptidase [Cryptosporangium aurantiacum]|uniref:CPBP family intramembrane glutamic endopeptidase n=1 Tax=Cryptosporangium aurantiacum TaxID=134849 RepID=UPI001FE5FAF9|nr:CPBP family intramembrane glutamic endopeptidase [Cryptosporangium aurantiacum]